MEADCRLVRLGVGKKIYISFLILLKKKGTHPVHSPENVAYCKYLGII